MATEVPSGQNFVEFYANLFRSYRRRNERDRVREQRNWDMFSGVNGKQWDPAALQQLIDEKRAPHQINFIQKNIQTLAGNFYQNDFEFDFEPNTGAPNDESLLLKDLYLTDRNRGGWAKARRKLIQAGLIHRGTVELFKDFKTDRLGSGGLRYVNHDRIIFDPDWRSDNINDNKHIIQFAWMTPPEIKHVYNKSAPEIETAIEAWNQSVSTRQTGINGGDDYNLYDDSPEFLDILNQRYLVIQVSRLERGVKRGAIDVDRNIELPDMSRENLDAMQALRGSSLKIIQNKFAKLKVSTVVPGLSLSLRLESDADHDLQIGTYQYHTWSSLNVNGEVQGEVDKLGDLQQIYNKRESTFTHWQTTVANGAEFVEEDFFANPTEQSRYVNGKNTPGETYMVGAGKLSGSKPGISTRPREAVPNDLHTSADRAFQMVPEVTPIVPALSGAEGKSGESAKLFEAKRGQALVALEPMRLSLQDFEVNLGESYFYFAKNNYSGAPREVNSTFLDKSILLNVPTEDGGVINDVRKIGRHSIIVKVSKNGESVRRELMGRYIDILGVVKNPLNATFVEKQLISVIPNIPDAEIAAGDKFSDLFMELQISRVELEIAQNKAGKAQFQQQAGGAAPGGAPGGPSAPGQTPEEGGGVSVEGAQGKPGQSLPVDLNNVNQLK